MILVGYAQIHVEVVTQTGLGIKTGNIPTLDQHRLDAYCPKLTEHALESVTMDRSFQSVETICLL